MYKITGTVIEANIKALCVSYCNKLSCLTEFLMSYEVATIIFSIFEIGN